MRKTNRARINGSKLPSNQFWIATTIVSAAFILIAYMLVIQHLTTGTTINNIESLLHKPMFNSTEAKAITDSFEKIDKSNLTVFNILLPVFGAWVGAVVAFYFGSENLKRAHESLDKVLPLEEKLSKITIEDLLDDYPAARNVVTVKMQDITVQDVIGKFGDLSNVLVVDANQKPLGILYKADLNDQRLNNKLQLTDQLANKIGIVVDHIAGASWDATKGVKNFARLSLKDNLLRAKTKMEMITENEKLWLAVRGVVLDQNGEVIAIVDYEMLTSGLLY